MAAKYKRPYATHVRNRDTHYDLGFAEAIVGAGFAGIGRMRNCHPLGAVLGLLLEEGGSDVLYVGIAVPVVLCA